MRRIESQLDVNSEAFRLNREHNQRLAAELRETGAPRALRASRARSRSAGAAEARCSSATVSRCCSIRARRSWSCHRWRPTRPTTAMSPSAGLGHRHRRRQRPRGDDSRRRREREGRRMVSAVGQEDRARAGYRDREPAAGDPSVRQRRRLPAAAVARSFPTALRRAASSATSAMLSQMGVKQLALVFGHCTAGGAYIPALSRLQRHRARHRRGLPRRAAAGEGGDRRGSRAPRNSAAPTCTPASAAPATIPPTTRRRRSHRRARSSRSGQRPQKWPIRARGARAAATTTRTSSTASSRDDIKKQFDMREVIARIVDGSRFHEYQPAYGTTLVCGYANHLGLQGRHPGQQRRAVQRQLAQGARTSCSCATRTARRWCSCRTSPATWSAANTSGAGITKDGAKMIMAQVGSRVPKFTVIVQRLVRRRQLRHVRPRATTRACCSCWPQSPDRRDGRRAGGQHAGRGKGAPARSAMARR